MELIRRAAPWGHRLFIVLHALTFKRIADGAARARGATGTVLHPASRQRV